MNKPNGQYVIIPQAMPQYLLLLLLSLAKIPGVGKVATKKLEEIGLHTCGDVQKADVAQLLKRFGKFGRVVWERSHGIDERGVVVESERKSVGVERTLAEDIHSWEACLEIIDFLYAELDRRLTHARSDKQIARQGVKLKFRDFQLTTQEYIWPMLNKEDLISVARKTWDERRAGRGGA
nr:hypothetical protein [Candidatus Pantoea persica]MBA2815557.1 DNA polymerase IV [Candidatus Pantoea persica]